LIVYGIKNCGSVRKAVKILKENGVEYNFFDFKKESVDEAKIREWLKETTIDKLFNNRGTKYRTLKLKELNLDEEGKIEWLAKENMLIKRPVIEYSGGLIVGFDEDTIRDIR
jgi:Spx/MgsR family transcriptional regulator